MNTNFLTNVKKCFLLLKCNKLNQVTANSKKKYYSVTKR